VVGTVWFEEAFTPRLIDDDEEEEE
jgi:hypothetical protein